MINYILQVLLFQVLFLAVYDFFLQKETFFKWNRIYLLVTPLLSFLIPFLKFESMQQTIPQEYVVQLPTVFLNPQAVIENTTTSQSLFNYLNEVYLVGALIFILLFAIRLYQIIALINKNTIVKEASYKLVILTKKQAAFSFFNYIFISKLLHNKKELAIIQHEIIHCKQKHSLDLLVFEVLKIAMWFNPLIYVYQKRITLLHEYIADAEVVKATNKKSYFNNLLSETFNVENISFINQFYKQSFIKKRIAMLTKNKSEKMKQFKYLLVIPLLLGMLIYSSCTDEANDELLEMETILSQTDTSNEGKYFDFKNGKVFVGKTLAGKIVPISEYTPKEKEFYLKVKNSERAIFNFSVIIDQNGERISFLKTNFKSDYYKSNWKYVEGEAVPFAKIEEVPVYPGCEGTEEELKYCLQDKITKHVNINFNTELSKNLGFSPGVKRIFVMFKIDKAGNITEVKARGPHQSLADEAIRVVNSLPKMIPGKYLGKNVDVKYSLPIAFKVEEDKKLDSDSEVNGNPIYMLDGKEISKEEMQKIKPDDIQSINVLKDASALKKYGEKGENGIIEITLKE